MTKGDNFIDVPKVVFKISALYLYSRQMNINYGSVHLMIYALCLSFGVFLDIPSVHS